MGIKQNYMNTKDYIKTLKNKIKEFPRDEVNALIKHPRLLHKIRKVINNCPICNDSAESNAMEGKAFDRLCINCQEKIKPLLFKVSGGRLEKG